MPNLILHIIFAFVHILAEGAKHWFYANFGSEDYKITGSSAFFRTPWSDAWRARWWLRTSPTNSFSPSFPATSGAASTRGWRGPRWAAGGQVWGEAPPPKNQSQPYKQFTRACQQGSSQKPRELMWCQGKVPNWCDDPYFWKVHTTATPVPIKANFIFFVFLPLVQNKVILINTVDCFNS